MDKAANLLTIDILKITVDFNNRSFSCDGVSEVISKATKTKKKYIIAVANMMTTMYGSVDDVNLLINALIKSNCYFKLHIDAAYGGFYYPFSSNNDSLTFKNKHITSFTLDAHKMAQAPYGTGIFIIRKGFIQNANTKEATYVEGEDYTLIGSRSGANAVAVWMILSKNGPHGWNEKIFILQKRAQWLCDQLDELNVKFYRQTASNIITIHSNFILPKIAKKYGLVPDNHLQPNWFKVIIMEHVTIEKLELLIDEIKISLLHKPNHLLDNSIVS
jgi:glutamate/tyrosine decarboxylase-like PLP-dependent enzyme